MQVGVCGNLKSTNILLNSWGEGNKAAAQICTALSGLIIHKGNSSKTDEINEIFNMCKEWKIKYFIPLYCSKSLLSLAEILATINVELITFTSESLANIILNKSDSIKQYGEKDVFEILSLTEFNEAFDLLCEGHAAIYFQAASRDLGIPSRVVLRGTHGIEHLRLPRDAIDVNLLTRILSEIPTGNFPRLLLTPYWEDKLIRCIPIFSNNVLIKVFVSTGDKCLPVEKDDPDFTLCEKACQRLSIKCPVCINFKYQESTPHFIGLKQVWEVPDMLNTEVLKSIGGNYNAE